MDVYGTVLAYVLAADDAVIVLVRNSADVLVMASLGMLMIGRVRVKSVGTLADGLRVAGRWRHNGQYQGHGQYSYE